MSEYQPYILYPDVPVGRTLAQLRTASNVTKGKMAQLLDVNPDTIARYERDPSTISLEQAIAYCDHLNIELMVRYR